MENFMRSRNIDHLYHFTRAENLENILEFGLMPRDDLDLLSIPSSYNDDYRYDNCTNAVCTSIEFPNYRMFYSLRKKHPEIDWAVLWIDANVLFELKCAFCWTNAGDATMFSTPIEYRMGIQAFKGLFSNRPNYPQRESLGIPDYYPTNPQAEVLVFDTIPTEYIKYIYFEDSATHDKYADIIPSNICSSWRSDIFGPRGDWDFWKTR